MRITCPNCASQYEVAEEAIPETGRDVQCAKCSEIWFQEKPRLAAPLTLDVPASDPEPTTPMFKSARTQATQEDFRQIMQEEAAYSNEQASEPSKDAEDISAQAQKISQTLDEARPASPDISKPAADTAGAGQDEPPRSLRDLMDQRYNSKEVKPSEDAATTESASAADESPFRKLTTETAAPVETQNAPVAEPSIPAAVSEQPQINRPVSRLADVQIQGSTSRATPADPSDVFADIDKLNSSLEQEAVAQGGGARVGSSLSATALDDETTDPFSQGASAGLVISVLAFGMYIASPGIASLAPGTGEFIDAARGSLDGVRLAIQDLYYQGGEPSFANFLTNLAGG